ncbi:hypothetical protein [Chromohalobacter sp. 48-RD10]|uniref:hypothetical protein n=1 Tax=Chromohalobacter sp. 48-RD10 TaxID=2994063 RepID=UPI002468C016|nr:hypothetical protein [Chromohalobacter sp. 48-RD10]
MSEFTWLDSVVSVVYILLVALIGAPGWGFEAASFMLWAQSLSQVHEDDVPTASLRLAAASPFSAVAVTR